MISRLELEDFELRRAVALPDGQKLLLRGDLPHQAWVSEDG